MGIRTVTRLASAAVAGGVATLALAVPAQADMILPDAGGSGSWTGGSDTASSSDSAWEVLPVATGALGGLALAGLGFAAVVGVRRRNANVAHPA